MVCHRASLLAPHCGSCSCYAVHGNMDVSFGDIQLTNPDTCLYTIFTLAKVQSPITALELWRGPVGTAVATYEGEGPLRSIHFATNSSSCKPFQIKHWRLVPELHAFREQNLLSKHRLLVSRATPASSQMR